MIRIRLDARTLARTRLATSPLNEVVGALHLLLRSPGAVPWPYTAWAERARAVLRDDPRLGPLRLYPALHGRWHERPTPDVFSPPPPSAGPSIGEELAALRSTPPPTVRAQLAKHYPGGGPAALAPYRDDPAAALDRLAAALAVFWQAAMAPFWPAIRTALDEEVLARSRSLATAGPAAVLGELRGRVRWEPPVLGLVKPVESAVDAAGRRLLLVPVLFAQDVLMCSTDDPEVLMVTYQARGAGVLAARRAARAGGGGDDRLALLTGPARAAVLRALVAPATTTGLARELGLAPSTVSQHLSTLLAAGLAERHRAGTSVLYALTPDATVLLRLLGPAA
ncbi:ArsR/SmtB family transcription factor [Dactylosporangium sp. McL0621]|uniref:ArsR/SmtB family transcription factor n=1 Tax=Dactylosporangium sp. McL0621 TaxID=3415678 RepID=UPI003CE93CC1